MHINITEILNDDTLNIIYNIVNVECHVCCRKFTLEKCFYKKQDRFYFCSKLCYEHN